MQKTSSLRFKAITADTVFIVEKGKLSAGNLHCQLFPYVVELAGKSVERLEEIPGNEREKVLAMTDNYLKHKHRKKTIK
jgi:hypothetical protein